LASDGPHIAAQIQERQSNEAFSSTIAYPRGQIGRRNAGADPRTLDEPHFPNIQNCETQIQKMPEKSKNDDSGPAHAERRGRQPGFFPTSGTATSRSSSAPNFPAEGGVRQKYGNAPTGLGFSR
jgi:hypothetical protein